MSILNGWLNERPQLGALYKILGMYAVRTLEAPQPICRVWIDWFNFKISLLDTREHVYLVIALPDTAPPDDRFTKRHIDNSDVQLLKIATLDPTRCTLLNRTILSSLSDIPGFHVAITRLLDSLALIHCSPDRTDSHHFEVFSELRFIGTTTHAVLIHPGFQNACSLFDADGVLMSTVADGFDKLPVRQHRSITEFFRTIRWWKPSMWEESDEELGAYTQEKTALFNVMGFREYGTAVPPRRKTNVIFEWGALRCHWKDYCKGTSPSSLHQALCVEISPNWCLKSLPKKLCFGNNIILGYYSDDYLSVNGIGILTDPTTIERDAAADMCYLLNASLDGYNCEFKFDYKILKNLGDQEARVELLGAGVALGNIIPGFVAFRDTLSARDNLGIYQFMSGYAELDDEAKASLCVMSSIFYGHAKVAEEFRIQHIDPIESRTCIICSQTGMIYYDGHHDLCFCDMDCMRRVINSTIGEGTNFNALLIHLK